MKIEIKKLGNQELNRFIELIRLFEDVFKMENFRIPGQDYLHQLLQKDSFYVFVALLDDKVIGGLTTYTMLQYYSTLPLVYIFDLAVSTEHQRKGIGKMLIKAVTNYCKEIGVQEVFVQADEVDGYALDFYHSTGATAEKVVHFNYPLNEDNQAGSQK
ncbi:MAG: GNAT family N-acetyltransferase [Chitinophagaceae bacterium]